VLRCYLNIRKVSVMYIRQVDEINWDGFKQSRYLSQNLVDSDMDISGELEFGGRAGEGDLGVRSEG
jgi:hypothetical protein